MNVDERKWNGQVGQENKSELASSLAIVALPGREPCPNQGAVLQASHLSVEDEGSGFNSFSKAIVAHERLREMRKSAAIMPAHK